MKNPNSGIGTGNLGWTELCAISHRLCPTFHINHIYSL